MECIKLLLLLSLASLLPLFEARTLRYVQAIWRHGDRAPAAIPYPNDTYGAEYWPRGWKELTNMGMRQMRELGEFYRSRYGDFVGPEYNGSEVFIQSSDENRALVSAQAFLNGLFPPASDADQFDAKLFWQPIPVHSTGFNNPDPLLKPSDFDCPYYDKLVEKVRPMVEAEMKVKYSKIFDFLAPYINEGRPLTFHQIRGLNNINREIAHGLKQPEWVTKVWPEYDNQRTIDIITTMWLADRLALYAGGELARLRGGFLLGDFLKRAKRILRNDPDELKNDSTKMTLYSSHDGTILSLLSAMNLNKDGRMVPYSASLIMEIHEEHHGKALTAELYFRHNGILERLAVEGCEEPCKLSKFIKVLKKNAVFKERNLYKKCGLSYCASKPKRSIDE